jgi:hypothetical protein
MENNSGSGNWGNGSTSHPLLACTETISGALKDVAELDPMFAPVAVKRDALVSLTRLIDRAEALRMSVIATSKDVAEAEAFRSVGTWIATQVCSETAPQSAAENLAHDLRGLYPHCRTALAAGRANLAQVRVITRALNELRRVDGVTGEVLTQAEEALVEHCSTLTPGELKTLADRILEIINPELFENAERDKIEKDLAKSRADAKLSMRKRGDGSTDVHARVPDSLALRLKTVLDAFTSPRHEANGDTRSPRPGGPGSLADGAVASRYRDPATGERLPQERVLGEAFCAFLERYDPSAMPKHGGMATTLVISTQLDLLTKELGIGTLPDGTKIPESDVRRLACNSGILPQVLNSKNVPINFGTMTRLYSVEQRIMLGLIHKTCQGHGCRVPAAWCEAHHRLPWSLGGPTDLANAMLLCSFHHQRIHDDSYLVKTMPNGDVRFHKRR